MIKIKRAYEPPEKKDGHRVLIDRMWPRGIKKEELEFDEWEKELAPSKELREYFGHEVSKWKTFQSRYKKELRSPEAKEKLAALAKKGFKKNLTLVYGAKDEEHNNAVVLKEVIEKINERNS